MAIQGDFASDAHREIYRSRAIERLGPSDRAILRESDAVAWGGQFARRDGTVGQLRFVVQELLDDQLGTLATSNTPWDRGIPSAGPLAATYRKARQRVLDYYSGLNHLQARGVLDAKSHKGISGSIGAELRDALESAAQSGSGTVFQSPERRRQAIEEGRETGPEPPTAQERVQGLVRAWGSAVPRRVATSAYRQGGQDKMREEVIKWARGLGTSELTSKESDAKGRLLEVIRSELEDRRRTRREERRRQKRQQETKDQRQRDLEQQDREESKPQPQPTEPMPAGEPSVDEAIDSRVSTAAGPEGEVERTAVGTLQLSTIELLSTIALLAGLVWLFRG